MSKEVVAVRSMIHTNVLVQILSYKYLFVRPSFWSFLCVELENSAREAIPVDTTCSLNDKEAACFGFLSTIPCSIITSLAEVLLYTFMLLLCGFMTASIDRRKM